MVFRMMIPYPVNCRVCKQRFRIRVRLTQSLTNWKCTSCGHKNTHSGFRWGEIGLRLWIRAQYELHKAHDPSLSIVLAAASVDCELTRIYFRRTRSASATPISDEILEEQLRTFGNIKDKITKVAKLLHQGGIDDFVKSFDWLREEITQQAPSLTVGSLASDIQKQLFWPRNRVLHAAAGYSSEDGSRCLSVGFAALQVFREMEFVAELRSAGVACP